MISFLIIVPTLNSHKLLSALANSLLQQTFSNWRVKFIDGASNNDHRECLDLLCNKDSRFSWENQLYPETGIFGAMNQGFQHEDAKNDWILFWGSDDQAASPLILESIAKKIETFKSSLNPPDLLVCNGTYYQQNSNQFKKDGSSFGRKTKFIYRKSFRWSLFLGSTPPHQATVFAPTIHSFLSSYATDLRLSADLDYFLKLSSFPKINVLVEDIEIVWIGDSGISNLETKRRLQEVRIAYKRSFGQRWWIPFLLRYLQKIQSLAEGS